MELNGGELYTYDLSANEIDIIISEILVDLTMHYFSSNSFPEINSSVHSAGIADIATQLAKLSTISTPDHALSLLRVQAQARQAKPFALKATHIIAADAAVVYLHLTNPPALCGLRHNLS